MQLPLTVELEEDVFAEDVELELTIDEAEDKELDDLATLKDALDLELDDTTELFAEELFAEELFTEEDKLDEELLTAELELTTITVDEDVTDGGTTATELVLIAELDNDDRELFIDDATTALEEEIATTELEDELNGSAAASEEVTLLSKDDDATDDCAEGNDDDSPPPQPVMLQNKLIAPIYDIILGMYILTLLPIIFM